MSSEKAKTVTVTALKYHTLDGHAYPEGTTYEVDEAHVANLVAQGMAKPNSPIPVGAHGNRPRTPSAEPAAATPKASQPVAPMTTADFGQK